MNERLRRPLSLVCVIAFWATLAHAAPSTRKAQSSSGKASVKRVSKTTHSAHGRKSRKSSRSRGQQAIQDDRARDIQQALIREKYLSGEPSGKWDQSTKDAMARYQSDNGWQTKSLPDSRALIKLGLGPSHQDILNPETAAISVPVSATPSGGGTVPGVSNRQ